MRHEAIYNTHPEVSSIVGDKCFNLNGVEVEINLTLVEAELSRLTAEYQSTRYQRLRAPEYPPMTDYLDAVYWQSRGDNSKMDAYLAAVDAVKQKYPKE